MQSAAAERALRYLLLILGAVMVLAGSATALFGASSIPGTGSFTPSVDSEMRFFAVWYVVVGVLTLLAARDLSTGPARATVWFVSAGFFAAGCARALSWAVVGRPSTQAVVLMVIELVLPVVLLSLHGRVSGSSAPDLEP